MATELPATPLRWRCPPVHPEQSNQRFEPPCG